METIMEISANSSSSAQGLKLPAATEQRTAEAPERNAERDRREVDETSRERIQRSDAGPGVGRRVDFEV